MPTMFRFALSTTAALVLIVAAACSSKEQEVASTATAEAQAPAPEPAPAPAPTPAPEPEPVVDEPVPQDAPPAEKTCGGDDQPLCPLGQWMDDNTRTAAEDGDLQALEAAFHKIEFMAPDPSWNEGEKGWNKISRRGAVAAAEGDLRASRRNCKGCHDQWRDRYEEEFWNRPVPHLPPNADRGDPDLQL